MKFRNPFFLENIMQDQPYCSLLLVAPFCDGACPGCQNTVLNDADVLDVSVAELAKTYRENPFVDGITVAGLEICLSGEEFVNDLVSFIERAQVPRVTIYSRFPPEHPRLKSILSRIAAIGSVEELYCKTGMFMQNSASRSVVLKSNNAQGQTWTISLASSNQEFHVLKGDSWRLAAA
jgi:hypothetical protein